MWAIIAITLLTPNLQLPFPDASLHFTVPAKAKRCVISGVLDFVFRAE